MAPSTFKGLVVVASGTFPGYKQGELIQPSNYYKDCFFFNSCFWHLLTDGC